MKIYARVCIVGPAVRGIVLFEAHGADGITYKVRLDGGKYAWFQRHSLDIVGYVHEEDIFTY